MHSLQKMSFSVLLCGVLVASSILFVPTDSLGALPKKKLEIIIGGDNFCKDNKDCAGDSFCNMTSHICIICPKPFEWVGGTQCVCPSGSVPNADNTDCVECMSDENCQALKGNLHWVCDTDTNTCECMSGLHEVGGECVCDNPNKTPDEDGNCICQLSQSDCPTSDFTGTNDCKCCPAETPKWDSLECRTCANVNRTKPYYNPDTKTCEECLTDAQCENEQVCSADKKCVCEMTQGDCSISDFNADVCLCCPASIPVYDSTSGTCKTCADIDDTKPYYNSDTKTCEECLTDAHCENEKVCSTDKTCVCDLTQEGCSTSGFMGKDICACCPLDVPYWDGTKCSPCTFLQPVYEAVNNKCTCDERLGYAPDLEDGKCVCRDKIIVPQQAIFARPTGCNEKELISGPIGPYVCTYDIYVKGHIDDDFLIVDEKGNVLLPSYGNQHHMVDGILYRLQPGTKIYIYAQDNFCDIIAWERDWHVSEARTPIPGTLELRLVK